MGTEPARGGFGGARGARGTARTARTARTASRHSLYYDLVDAFDHGGCPICRLALAGVYRWLDAFAYESVNDYDVRTALRKSMGFCTTHAWQLVDDVHDLMGAAIVYRDVIHTTLPDVPQAVDHPEVLKAEGQCRACTALEATSTRYLDLFAESLPDRAFREAYESAPAGAALCLPHAASLLGRVGRHEEELAARLLTDRWGSALEPGNNSAATPGLADGRPRRRYRGVAGASGTFSASSFVAPEPAILRDPAVGPLELLVGRLRTGPLASGLRITPEGEIPAAPDAPEPRWEEVCEPGACPICRLVLASEDEWLRGGDSVGSMDEAEVLALCNAHGWRLAARGHAEVLRAACEQAVRTRTAALIKGPSAGVPTSIRNGSLLDIATLITALVKPPPAARRLEPEDDCVWCVERAEFEAAFIDRLLAAVEHDQDVAAIFARSGGLCRLHFVRAMERGKGSTAAQVLARLQAERWAALRADLLEYLRKQDYQYRDEPRGDEQSSPWRATEQVAGAREIRP